MTLVGFLYCEEFEELNKKIARGELATRELTKEILQHPQVLPTAALTMKRLKEEHGLSDERAQVRKIQLTLWFFLSTHLKYYVYKCKV